MQNVSMGSVAAVVATVDPKTVANTIQYTDVIDMADMDQVMAIALTGDMAAETIDFACYYCDSDGGNPASLKAATQLAAHASNNDNSQIVICVKASELLAAGKRYVKFGLVTGNSTGGAAAVVAIGYPLRAGLAGDQDLASVKQVKQ